MATTAACFVAAYFYVSRQLADARQELVNNEITLNGQQRQISKLKTELGVITVTDPTKVHVLMLPTHDPCHWKWRVYWPGAGTSCSVCLAVGEIPASGFSVAPVGTINFGISEQMTVEALLRRDSEGKRVFTVQVPGKGTMNHVLTDEQADRLAACDRFNLAGGESTQIVAKSGPVELLRDRKSQPGGFRVLLWLQ